MHSWGCCCPSLPFQQCYLATLPSSPWPCVLSPFDLNVMDMQIHQISCLPDPEHRIASLPVKIFQYKLPSREHWADSCVTFCYCRFLVKSIQIASPTSMQVTMRFWDTVLSHISTRIQNYASMFQLASTWSIPQNWLSWTVFSWSIRVLSLHQHRPTILGTAAESGMKNEMSWGHQMVGII